MNNLCYINNLDLFSGISPDEMARLCEHVREETYPSKRLLYIPSDTLSSFYVVKVGEVIRYKIQNDRRVVIDSHSPGDVFGVFVERSESVGHFAEATPGTRICTVPVKDFQRVIAAHPEVMLHTLELLSSRLSEYEDKIALCPAPAKDKVLQEISRHERKHDSDSNARRMTHQHIADLTGLNRVTVTRALQELQSDGSVELNDNGNYTTHS